MKNYIAARTENNEKIYWNKSIGWVSNKSQATIYTFPDSIVRDCYGNANWFEGPAISVPEFINTANLTQED